MTSEEPQTELQCCFWLSNKKQLLAAFFKFIGMGGTSYPYKPQNFYIKHANDESSSIKIVKYSILRITFMVPLNSKQEI